MRDRMERFVILPFSVSCISESSVAVAVHHQRRPRPFTNSSSSSATRRGEYEEESSSSESMKLPKPDISAGFHRLFKTFKNFSQFFAYKEEMEELEREMEIGFPTDVKHVTHIGWDGPVTTNPTKGWEDLMSLPSIPPQPDHHSSPLCNAST